MIFTPFDLHFRALEDFWTSRFIVLQKSDFTEMALHPELHWVLRLALRTSISFRPFLLQSSLQTLHCSSLSVSPRRLSADLLTSELSENEPSGHFRVLWSFPLHNSHFSLCRTLKHTRFYYRCLFHDFIESKKNTFQTKKVNVA